MKIDIERVVEFDVEEMSKSELEANLDRQIEFYNKIKSRSQNIFTVIIGIIALLATAISGNLPEVFESFITLYNVTVENELSPEASIEVQLTFFFVFTAIIFIMDSIIWLSEILSIRNPEMLLGSAREVNDELDFSFNSFSSISPLEHEEQRYQESVRLNNYLLQYMSERIGYGYASLSSGLQSFISSIMVYWTFSVNIKLLRYAFVFGVFLLMTLGIGSLIISLFIDWNRELEILGQNINLNILTFAPGYGKDSKSKSVHTANYFICLVMCLFVYPYTLIYLHSVL